MEDSRMDVRRARGVGRRRNRADPTRDGKVLSLQVDLVTTLPLWVVIRMMKAYLVQQDWAWEKDPKVRKVRR